MKVRPIQSPTQDIVWLKRGDNLLQATAPELPARDRLMPSRSLSLLVDFPPNPWQAPSI